MAPQKKARSQNFSIMEVSVIHNEVQQNSILETMFTNNLTNQKKKKKPKLYGKALQKKLMQWALP